MKRSNPAGGFCILSEHDREDVGDRALLDHQRAVHVGFAEFEFGIEHDAEFGCMSGKAHGHRHARAIAKCEGFSARGAEIERPSPDKVIKQNLKQPVHRPHP